MNENDNQLSLIPFIVVLAIGLGGVGAWAEEDALTTRVDLGKLSANWRFAHDADKIPFFKKFMSEGKLLPSKYNKGIAMCNTFPKDLQNGKFEVIEWDYQALSWAEIAPDDVRSKSNYLEKLPRNDIRQIWEQCVDEEPDNSRSAFRSIVYLGEKPPFRFYHVPLDSQKPNNFADILLGNANEYSHAYHAVDFKNCKLTSAQSALFPYKNATSEYPTLSLLIRYRDRVMALIYQNWAHEGGADETYVSVSLGGFGENYENCSWMNPVPKEL